MNSGEKQHIMRCRLIGRAAADHSVSFGVFVLLDVAQRDLPETLGAAGRAIRPKELMASREKPVRCSRPPLRIEMAVAVLPYKLNHSYSCSSGQCCGAERNIP